MTENSIHNSLLPAQPLFGPDSVSALAFTRAQSNYEPTQLQQIVHNGHQLMIKDESTRFGLGSFKALGGIYAVAQLILEAVEAQTGDCPSIADLQSPGVRAVADTQTYICASAGNHGMAVATGAQLFGAHARIHVSSEVPPSFATRLKQLGAQVCVSGVTYEESLAAANEDVLATGALLLSDGSWAGYTHPPSLIMEGYTVMASELYDSFHLSGNWPSDVYLQAGVGGMAAAVVFMIRQYWPMQPRIVIVEPNAADCLALSAFQGSLLEAIGPVSTMGRLDCKAASLLAFDTLERSNVEYCGISDEEASEAVSILGRLGMHTTPSGAAGFAAWMIDETEYRTVGYSPLVIMSEQAID